MIKARLDPDEVPLPYPTLIAEVAGFRLYCQLNLEAVAWVVIAWCPDSSLEVFSRGAELLLKSRGLDLGMPRVFFSGTLLTGYEHRAVWQQRPTEKDLIS